MSLRITLLFRPEESSPTTFIIPSATQTSSTTPATMSQNNIAMVPVHQEDFKKFNEFAEAAWICRDLENADRIKEIRKTLLKEVYKISLKVKVLLKYQHCSTTRIY